jgi:hypothetical protein
MVLEPRRVGPYIATGKRSRDRNLPPAPKGRIPTHLTIRQRMERKLLTNAGRAASAAMRPTSDARCEVWQLGQFRVFQGNHETS